MGIISTMTDPLKRRIDLSTPAIAALYKESEKLLQSSLYAVCEVLDGKVTRPELFNCMQTAMLEQDHLAIAQFAFAIHALAIGEGRKDETR